jgi:hypothetical protein
MTDEKYIDKKYIGRRPMYAVIWDDDARQWQYVRFVPKPSGPDEKYTGWRRQRITLDVLAYRPLDPADWNWRQLIRHGAADVVDADPPRMPGEES